VTRLLRGGGRQLGDPPFCFNRPSTCYKGRRERHNERWYRYGYASTRNADPGTHRGTSLIRHAMVFVRDNLRQSRLRDSPLHDNDCTVHHDISRDHHAYSSFRYKMEIQRLDPSRFRYDMFILCRRVIRLRHKMERPRYSAEREARNCHSRRDVSLCRVLPEGARLSGRAVRVAKRALVAPEEGVQEPGS
jgi:hypothetical protein